MLGTTKGFTFNSSVAGLVANRALKLTPATGTVAYGTAGAVPEGVSMSGAINVGDAVSILSRVFQ